MRTYARLVCVVLYRRPFNRAIVDVPYGNVPREAVGGTVAQKRDKDMTKAIAEDREIPLSPISRRNWPGAGRVACLIGIQLCQARRLWLNIPTIS